MGMTIAEPIQTLEYLRDSGAFPFKLNKSVMKPNVPIIKEEVLYTAEAIDEAIDTMLKYQKIQKIVKEWREVGLEYDSCDAMMNIERIINREVISYEKRG